MDKIQRLIDANLNRSREGLRVCEDIARFVLEDKKITASFKSLRHRIGALSKGVRGAGGSLEWRNARKDVGKKTLYGESERKDIDDVFFANVQRVKESLRVLEEATKLLDRKISESFKRMRYRLYDLEKKSQGKLEAVLHRG